MWPCIQEGGRSVSMQRQVGMQTWAGVCLGVSAAVRKGVCGCFRRCGWGCFSGGVEGCGWVFLQVCVGVGVEG